MYCTQCGSNLPVDAAFCPSCGFAARSVATTARVAPAPPRAEAATSSVPRPRTDTSLQCPKCGLFSPGTASRCDCGHSFAPVSSGSIARGRSAPEAKSSGHLLARLEGPARWTKWLLIATIALCSIGIVSGMMQVELMSRAAQGFSDAEAAANDSRQQAIGTLQLLLLIATAIFFLTWFYRAHSNLAVVSSIKPMYTSGWAVGGFFVPFLNLVRPVQVMRELWQGTMSGTSSATSGAFASVQPSGSTPPLVGWWWGLFLVSNILGNVTMRLAFRDSPTLADLEALSWLQVLHDGLDIPTAVLAILLVDRITKRQLEAVAGAPAVGG
jgi:hypothetical protein